MKKGAAALIAVITGRFGQRAAPHVRADEEGRGEFARDRDLVQALAVDPAEIAHQAIDHVAGFTSQRKSLPDGAVAAADLADLKIGRSVFARVAEDHRLSGAG
jgi:hypothetical protein